MHVSAHGGVGPGLTHEVVPGLEIFLYSTLSYPFLRKGKNRAKI